MNVKVYVANLRAYNEGDLVGKWYDLGELDSDELWEDIKKEVLFKGRDEEVAIHDYEAPFKIEEYANITELNDSVRELLDLNEWEQVAAVILYDIGAYSTLQECVENVDSIQISEVESLEELAEQQVDEGLYGDIPANLEGYIDYEKIARELSMDWNEIVVDDIKYFYRQW